MKLIILDRDGVINADSKAFIKSPDEWQPIPGSLKAIATLNHAGYQVVVASNQSGIARGLLNIDTLNAIHRKFYDELEQVGGHLAAILFCPHGPDDGCSCRKPGTGMFEEIAKRFHCKLEGIWAVGDSLRDLQAAESAGAKPILVRTGNGATLEQQGMLDSSTPIFDNLSAVVDALLQSTPTDRVKHFNDTV